MSYTVTSHKGASRCFVFMSEFEITEYRSQQEKITYFNSSTYLNSTLIKCNLSSENGICLIWKPTRLNSVELNCAVRLWHIKNVIKYGVIMRRRWWKMDSSRVRDTFHCPSHNKQHGSSINLHQLPPVASIMPPCSYCVWAGSFFIERHLSLWIRDNEEPQAESFFYWILLSVLWRTHCSGLTGRS